MSKWTPGPWVSDGALIYADRGIQPYIAVCKWRGETLGNAEANARLISLAPEMAEALRELHAIVVGESPSLLNEDSGGSGELDIRIRALLAKLEAEG